MNDAAIAGEEAALRNGDDVAKWRHPVLQRHGSVPSRERASNPIGRLSAIKNPSPQERRVADARLARPRQRQRQNQAGGR
jgi:hypothetical protein